MPLYFAIETRANSEINTAKKIAILAKQYDLPIYSILFNPDIRGYIFIECESREDLPFVVSDISTARRLLKGKITQQEAVSMLSTKEEPLSPGDEIEITGGPFKLMNAEVIEVKDGRVVVMIDEWEHAGRITISRGDVRRK